MFGRSFFGWRPDRIDLLASPATRVVHLELTSNCNLRCVYCAVSQPWYHGNDMDVTDVDALARTLKSRGVRMLVVNGHGETRRLRSIVARLRRRGRDRAAALAREWNLGWLRRLAHKFNL